MVLKKKPKTLQCTTRTIKEQNNGSISFKIRVMNAKIDNCSSSDCSGFILWEKGLDH